MSLNLETMEWVFVSIAIFLPINVWLALRKSSLNSIVRLWCEVGLLLGFVLLNMLIYRNLELPSPRYGLSTLCLAYIGLICIWRILKNPEEQPSFRVEFTVLVLIVLLQFAILPLDSVVAGFINTAILGSLWCVNVYYLLQLSRISKTIHSFRIGWITTSAFLGLLIIFITIERDVLWSENVHSDGVAGPTLLLFLLVLLVSANFSFIFYIRNFDQGVRLKNIVEQKETEASLEIIHKIAYADRRRTLEFLSYSFDRELEDPLRQEVEDIVQARTAFDKSDCDRNVLSPYLKKIIQKNNEITDSISKVQSLAKNRNEAEVLVELTSLISDVLNFVNHDCHFLGFEPTFERAEGPVMVKGNYEMVFQVLIHIMNNTISALSNSLVKEVKIILAVDGDQVFVDILDSGCGFGDRQLVEKFSLIRVAGEEKLGFGLPISKKIIELFGGSLSISNRDEGGARVAIVLPRCSE